MIRPNNAPSGGIRDRPDSAMAWKAIPRSTKARYTATATSWLFTSSPHHEPTEPQPQEQPDGPPRVGGQDGIRQHGDGGVGVGICGERRLQEQLGQPPQAQAEG